MVGLRAQSLSYREKVKSDGTWLLLRLLNKTQRSELSLGIDGCPPGIMYNLSRCGLSITGWSVGYSGSSLK